MKNFEKHMEDGRAKSDAEKIATGAKHTKDGRLEFTDEQVEEAREEMGKEKKTREEELFGVRRLEKDRAEVLERLEEELKPTVEGLRATGWEGENLDLPADLREDIEKIVEDTKGDPMIGRCRKIRDLLNGKYRRLSDADIEKYRNLLNDENLEKYFNEVENIKSVREQKHRLEKIQIK